MDPVALADTNNPTMHNPACTVCHTGMDPVAGAFQDYGDEGFYKDQWGGMDSLHELYKNGEGADQIVEANSWRNRETLTWQLFTSSRHIHDRSDLHEPFLGPKPSPARAGEVYLDRLDVLDRPGTAGCQGRVRGRGATQGALG